MTRTGLRRQLVGIGRRAGRGAESGRIRFIALLAATAVLGIGFISAVAVNAVYDGRSARETARLPVSPPGPSAASAQELWAEESDTVAGRQFSVILISPLTADAPLPPGVARWPGPGEAVLSPALLADGSAEGIATRYGRVVGSIAPSGLSGPGERLAYVRPAANLLPQRMDPVIGYGPTDEPPFGDALQAKPAWMFAPLLGGLILLPAAVLLLVAARTGSRGRDRRLALATVLGADRVDRALITVGDAGGAIAAGAALALVPLAAALSWNIRLPVAEYTLSSADLRSAGWALLLAWTLAIVTVLAAVAVLDHPPSRSRTRTQPLGSRRAPKRWAALCPVMVLVAVRGPDLFDAGTPLHMLVNYAGILGTLATLPAVVAMAAAACGRLIARAGRALGRPGVLISGRWLAAHPGMIARVSVGIITAVGLLIQVQVWFGFLGGPAQAAEALHAALGNSVMVVKPASTPEPDQWSSFVRSMPATTASLSLELDSSGRLRLQGGCAALGALRLPCSAQATPLTGSDSDPRLLSLLSYYGAGTTSQTVRLGDPAANTSPDADTVLLLVSVDGSNLSAPPLEQDAYRTIAGGATVAPVGGDWITGALVNADQGRWIELLGLLGVVVLSAACGISGLGEFLRWGKAMAPVSVLTGNRRVFLTSAAFVVLLPVGLSGLLGVVAGLWLALPMVEQGFSHFSGAMPADCSISIVGLALAFWAWASWSARRQSASWLPGDD